MASNFKIIAHRSCDTLHLKLMGDFDGSSAWQLFNVLEKRSTGLHRIIIDTSCVHNIYPFGLHMFHQIFCGLKGNPNRFAFTGENSNEISPKREFCL